MTREELAEYQRSKRYKFRSELMCLANSVGNAKDAEKASVALDKLEEYVISRQKLLLEKIGKLTNAISAIQMLIEEDIEERNGFTFNRKKMLDIAEEALK